MYLAATVNVFAEHRYLNLSVFLELGSTVGEDLPSTEVLGSTSSTEKKKLILHFNKTICKSQPQAERTNKTLTAGRRF